MFGSGHDNMSGLAPGGQVSREVRRAVMSCRACPVETGELVALLLPMRPGDGLCRLLRFTDGCRVEAPSASYRPSSIPV